MKYWITTYGCQMNQSDSERIVRILERNGYTSAPKIIGADLIILNICSVRQKPIDKAKNKVFLIRRENPKAKIIATGCILEQDKKWLEKQGVEIKKYKNIAKTSPENGLVPITRGCNNFCSYCVVPFTRGREKHRSEQTIIKEVKCLLKKGVKKITLLGQNVNSYQWKIKNQKSKIKIIDFADLLKEINNLNGDFRISFLTNHPRDMSDKLIETIAKCDKVVKYVHLPLQSGDNFILKKMNRKYTSQGYLKLINKIKKAIPNVEITTDVIVGFPGETKKQFQNTVVLFKKIKFNNAYISKYSPRQGTSAFNMKDNVSLQEKKQREQILRNIIKTCKKKS